MIDFLLVATEHILVIFDDSLNYIVLLQDSFEGESKTWILENGWKLSL